MDLTATIELLLHGNQLKRTARTGWIQRGVAQPEDVAAHSFGVAFATLVLSQSIAGPVDLGRALAMALLHDLPEGLTSDIPAPAWLLLPPGVKPEMERAALDKMLGENDLEPTFLAWWDELEAGESVEARLVHDADKVDLFVQALIYEQQTGNRRLQQFWDWPIALNFPETQAIYEELQARRLQP